jgi:hypothetical protein
VLAPPRGRRRAAAAAAAIAVLGLLGWALVRGAVRSPASPGIPSPSLQVLPAGPYIRSFTATVELRGEDGTYAVTRRDGAHVTELQTRWTTSPAAHVVCEVCSLETSLR